MANSYWLNNNSINIWNVTSGDCIKILVGHSNWVTCIAFSPDNQFIVNSDNMGYIMFWDLGQNKKTALWQASHYAVKRLNFSAEGNLLVTTGKQEESTLNFPLQALNELITTGCQQIGDFLQNRSKVNPNHSPFLCDKVQELE